jgi:hypothetical protein
LKDTGDINNMLFFKLIENSIFTHRQIQIIYNFSINSKRSYEISSGAYYRQVKQTRMKLKKICYSIMLLNLMNLLNTKQMSALTSIIDQLRLLNDNHEKYHKDDLTNVMNVIDEMIIKVINL